MPDNPLLPKELSKISKEASAKYLKEMAEDMLRGETPIEAFLSIMLTELKEEFIRQYIYGVGGRENMQPADWGYIGGNLGSQYKYAMDFVEAVGNEELSDEQILSRLDLYTEKSDELFEKGNEVGHEREGYTQEIWIIDEGKENCEDCLYYAELGWVEIGTLPTPCDGNTACMNNCGCHKEYGFGDEEQQREGTSSSGNWGHEGVKGQLGGSAPASSDNPADYQKLDWTVADKVYAQAGGDKTNASLTDDEKKAINTWSGENYGQIQQVARYGEPPDDLPKEYTKEYMDYWTKIVDDLDSAIEKGPALPENTKLFRVFDTKNEKGKEFIDKLVNEGKAADPGFLATGMVTLYGTGGLGASSHGGWTFGDTRITILAPAGLQFLMPNTASEESELLFPRNTELTLISNDPETGIIAKITESITREGNENSGNYGHAGRPGEEGGSAGGEIIATLGTGSYDENSNYIEPPNLRLDRESATWGAAPYSERLPFKQTAPNIIELHVKIEDPYSMLSEAHIVATLSKPSESPYPNEKQPSSGIWCHLETNMISGTHEDKADYWVPDGMRGRNGDVSTIGYAVQIAADNITALSSPPIDLGTTDDTEPKEQEDSIREMVTRPWSVKHVGSKWCVYDKNGKKLKSYNTKKEAEDYQKALYANSGEEL